MAPQPNQQDLQEKRAEILEELMRSKKRRLWSQARRFSASDQDADDALEDACLAFLRHFRPDTDPHAPLPVNWMLTTVKHAAFRIHGRNVRLRERDAQTKIPFLSDTFWQNDVCDPVATLVEEQVEDREWARTCGRLLTELKPDERTALSLIGFGLSYREVAERQGWTATKVNRCVSEGRMRLRELLALRGEKP